MKKADLPANEKGRLQALMDYEILDTLIDKSYDELTELAAEICETPIALISLLDEKRQWFKSHFGLDATEAPRELAFCGHAILQNSPFIIEDSHLDERFSDNPFVTGGLLVRFYGGVPLQTPEGFNIGTLCVIDQKVKTLNEMQINSLQILSKQVINLLELKKNLKIQSDQKAQLMNTAKMASLGEMASGVAHEINNPLSIIKGKCDQIKILLKSDLVDIEKINNHLERIDIMTERMIRIVRGLENFSRNSSDDTMIARSINKIIEDTLILCHERFVKHSIEIKMNLKDDQVINCLPSEISQVLMNLLSNAHDAIEGLSEKWIEIKTAVDAGYLKIMITDSGKGIREEHLEKIMQPFFTTKEVGKGTGLGLSISFGIIKKHQGTLEYVRESVNTSFVISLPITF